MDADLESVLTQAAASVADLRHRSAWAASSDDCAEMVGSMQDLINQLVGVQAAHARELDARGWPRTQGASSIGVWLRDRLRISIHAAKRLTALGALVDARPITGAAVETGEVNGEQAAVIDTALADLPTDVGPAIVEACERLLVAHAATLEPQALRIAGERILAHVAPEVADAALRAKLDRDEDRARITRALTLTPIGRGQVRLIGCVDTESAATIQAAIDPLARPRPGSDDARTPAQRRADALIDVCRLALATDELPDHGGTRPQLTVTVNLDQVTGALASACSTPASR